MSVMFRGKLRKRQSHLTFLPRFFSPPPQVLVKYPIFVDQQEDKKGMNSRTESEQD